MTNLHDRRNAPMRVPSDISQKGSKDIAAALNLLLADTFALYFKTKNFHWHVSGLHFRGLHLLFDEQATQIFAMTDPVAERVRKIGETTLRSTGDVSRRQRILDNDAEFVTPKDMVAELCDDNLKLATELRATHAVCSEHNDFASTSLIENWIDETERRVWFLYETSRNLGTEA